MLFSKAKGLGNADSNPLLNEEERKQPLDAIGDEENPWGTLNEENKYDNANDLQSAPSRQSKRRSKKQHLLSDDNYQQLDSSSDNAYTTPPQHKTSSSVTTPIRSNQPYLIPPARSLAQKLQNVYPSPYQFGSNKLDEKESEMDRMDKNKEFYVDLNEELFLYCLSFLNNSDLTVIAQVRRYWKECSYQPVLWRRLDLSSYSDGSHDYLLKHILLNDPCNRFNHVLEINLENCSALTDQSLLFITEKCPFLRVLYLTNCYRLSPKTIYFTVRKLQYLHKLELYGVISTHNKYYHIQQLQQLTFFLNELGIHSGHIATAASRANNNNNNNNNGNNDRNGNRNENGNDNNNNGNGDGNDGDNNNARNGRNGRNERNGNDRNADLNDPAIQNAQNIANQGDDANAAANPAAPANNAQAEANMIDNQPSLNNRIQRVRLMICLAKSIKNCRPWMDLGLFWMQILSMVGRNDPLMILDLDQYQTLYNVRNEMGNDFYLNHPGDAHLFAGLMRERFHGARYMTLNEYKLYAIRREMQLEAQMAANIAVDRGRGDEDDDEDDDADDEEEEEEEEEVVSRDENDRLYPVGNGINDGEDENERKGDGEYLGVSTTSSPSRSSLMESAPKKVRKQRMKKGKKKRMGLNGSVLDRVDMDFELSMDHEWMRNTNALSSRSPSKKMKTVDEKKRGRQRPSSLEMDILGNQRRGNHHNNNNNNGNDNDNDYNYEYDSDHDDSDGFYPKHGDYDDALLPNGTLLDEDSSSGDIATAGSLLAFHKLAIQKLQRHFHGEYNKALPPNLQVADCRYFGRFQGGCWGRVIGRIVYSNVDYQQGGNYPCEVLFSCEAHSNEDFTDELLDKCQSCERLFRAPSMCTNSLICRTCFDSKKLQQKAIWVNLNKKGLKAFNFAHVCQYTLKVADRRHLPKTLKSYGKVKAQLTYETAPRERENNNRNNNGNGGGGRGNGNNNGLNGMDDDEEEEEEEKRGIEDVADISRVNIHTFWEHNEQRISQMMDKFKSTLKKAQTGKATRAILVYHDPKQSKEERKRRLLQEMEQINGDHNRNANGNGDDDGNGNGNDVVVVEAQEEEEEMKYIEVLADPGVLFDGLDGVDYIFLTVSAWTQFYSIFCPILLSILCSLYMLYELSVYNYDHAHNQRIASSSAKSQAISLPDAPSNNAQNSLYLFWALGAFLVLITGAFIAYRFQRRCEQIFRCFLVVDIFLILAIGCAILTAICGENYNLTMDHISFWMLVYNFGAIGVMTFYCSVPPLLHRVFLVTLNCIMSIMITSAIKWYVLFLLLILICADIIAMLKPSFGRMFSPFLVPTQIQLPNTTPRIFYQVYGLRVRAPEFMFYGLFLGLIEPNDDAYLNEVNHYYTQVVLLLITVISGFVISVFVMPFFSKRIRPLPVSFGLLVISIIFYEQIFKSYQDANVWSLVVP